MNKLTIFIHCHNRPVYARRTIESVLNQTNRDFHLVVSDNSSNDELSDLMRAEFPGLDYRRRSSSLSALDHFNTNIAETETEYVCLFHDDDLMEPGYVDAMLRTIALFPHAVAYSCNAQIIDDDDLPKGASFESGHAHVFIESPRTLAGRYFSRFPNGIAPFPAYIYRSDIVKKTPINHLTGGKYSDVAWLLEISKCGLFAWNSEKLIRYRIHAGNDGGLESLRDRLRLLGYLKKNRSFVGQAIINDFRFFLYKKLHKSGLAGREFPDKFESYFSSYLQAYRLRRFIKPETYYYLSNAFRKLFK